MISIGKKLCVAYDTGQHREFPVCIGVCVLETTDNNEFTKICDNVAVLVNRFCLIENCKVFHIHDNLLIVLMNQPTLEDAETFEKRLRRHILAKSKHRYGRYFKGINVKLSSCIYKNNERFGRFFERTVAVLVPGQNWVSVETR
eukprot:UN30444